MKRNILIAIAITISVILAAPVFSANEDIKLPIPTLLEARYDEAGIARYELRAGYSSAEFLEGLVTPTMSYEGDFLGPTLRVRRGDEVAIDVHNGLDDVTTLHWHGLHVPAESDGGPHQEIAPGETWTAEFRVKHQAATLWYHPHAMGKTGEQVYAGLSGLFIIDDENSTDLDLPATYGVDDIPLIIQDRRFAADGRFLYVQSTPDIMHGIAGEIMLVNGKQRPVLEVPKGVVRFRILNGSDANVFRIRFSDGRSYHQIATDGGFLDESLEVEAAILATGERLEIVADFSEMASDSEVLLVVDDYYGRSFEALRVQIDDSLSAEYETMADIDSRFNSVPRPLDVEGLYVRKFEMQSMGPRGQLTINGTRMDMGKIDERVPVDTSEIWEVTNPSMGMMAFAHTFHIHDGQFLIIDINGEEPPPQLAGWKDTFLVWPNDRLRILVRFEEYTGIYMYHCHFLVHEDAGMMGQFEVYEPGK